MSERHPSARAIKFKLATTRISNGPITPHQPLHQRRSGMFCHIVAPRCPQHLCKNHPPNIKSARVRMVPETQLRATIAITLVVPRGMLITCSHAPKSSRAQKERGKTTPTRLSPTRGRGHATQPSAFRRTPTPITAWQSEAGTVIFAETLIGKHARQPDRPRAALASKRSVSKKDPVHCGA